MNTEIPYKVIKLTTGEEIVCRLGSEIVNDEYQLNYPLKMEVRTQITNNGAIDSLNLSRWIGSYTKQSLFHIKTNHVLLVAEASEGLCRYYDHVIKEIKRLEKSRPMDMDEDDDGDIDDIELLNEILSSDDTIH